MPFSYGYITSSALGAFRFRFEAERHLYAAIDTSKKINPPRPSRWITQPGPDPFGEATAKAGTNSNIRFQKPFTPLRGRQSHANQQTTGTLGNDRRPGRMAASEPKQPRMKAGKASRSAFPFSVGKRQRGRDELAGVLGP